MKSEIELALTELKGEQKEEIHELIARIGVNNFKEDEVEKLRNLLNLPNLGVQDIKTFFFQKVEEAL